MLFPTIDFGIFCLTVLVAIWSVSRKPAVQKYILLAASFLFIGYLDLRFVPVFFLSGYSSFYFGKKISATEETSKRKRLVVFSIFISLAVLFFFKYFSLLLSGFNTMTALFGIEQRDSTHNPVLTLGLSFFTLQSISYVVDLYRRELADSKSIPDVLLYLVFFPKLIAGPVMKTSDFFAQLGSNAGISGIKASQAAALILKGLFKKLVIANYLAMQIVDPVFQRPENFSSFDALMGAFAFALQLYCSFSAYSDMASGISLLLGYELPENFNQPFRAKSLRDFWKRWNVTLTEWLKDYLYINLGGNKNGKSSTYRNLFLTVVLGGIWYGAGFNFVFFGILSGASLLLERYLSEKRERAGESVPVKLISSLYVITFVSLSLVFVRAENFSMALEYFMSIFRFDFSSSFLTPLGFSIVMWGILSHFLPKDWGSLVRTYFERLHPLSQAMTIGMAVLVIRTFGLDIEANINYFLF